MCARRASARTLIGFPSQTEPVKTTDVSDNFVLQRRDPSRPSCIVVDLGDTGGAKFLAAVWHCRVMPFERVQSPMKGLKARKSAWSKSMCQTMMAMVFSVGEASLFQ